MLEPHGEVGGKAFIVASALARAYVQNPYALTENAFLRFKLKMTSTLGVKPFLSSWLLSFSLSRRSKIFVENRRAVCLTYSAICKRWYIYAPAEVEPGKELGNGKQESVLWDWCDGYEFARCVWMCDVT